MTLRTINISLMAFFLSIQSSFPQSDSKKTFLSAYFENDLFYDQDNAYTDGVKAQWSFMMDEGKEHLLLPDNLLHRLFQPACKDNPDACWEWWGGFTAGQNMYTPETLTTPNILPEDRPYGGLLYLGGVLTFYRPDQGEQRGMQHSLEIDIGVTGPLSFAEEAQSFIHGSFFARKAPEPQGWGNQIPFEPGIVLNYGGKARLWDKLIRYSRVFDIIPEWNAVTGTFFTYAGVGVSTRLGWNLGNDFGSNRVTPVAAGMGRKSDFEIYVFAGTNGRFVLDNVFLNGGFRDAPHTVELRHWVADADLGVFMRLAWVGLTYRWVWRSPEFREKASKDHTYGAANLTVVW